MWLLLSSVAALACSLAPAVAHVVDPAFVDIVAPNAPTVTPEVSRGRAAILDVDTCVWVTSSCDDIGSVTLVVSAMDPETPADQMGTASS